MTIFASTRCRFDVGNLVGASKHMGMDVCVKGHAIGTCAIGTCHRGMPKGHAIGTCTIGTCTIGTCTIGTCPIGTCHRGMP